jgi:Cu-Zn family superoxide dismutase
MTTKAIAVFTGKIKGTVKFFEFEEDGKLCVAIDINLTGLKKNALHGFHVHECGDLSNKCESMCAHYNPYKKKHGCPGMKERHVGDLGNLVTDSKGCAKYITVDHLIKLNGVKGNIIGRGLIIHADPDDCGLGGHETSLTTGNSGKRIACAVIGIASPSCVMDNNSSFMKFEYTNNE